MNPGQAAQVWSDTYGSVRASYLLAPGGPRWLVAAAPAQAAETARALERGLEGSGTRLKGEVHLLIYAALTPLQAAAREVQPRGVVVVGEWAGGGPATQVPQRSLDAPGGLSYREGGEFPAWNAALQLPGAQGAAWRQSGAASACAALGLDVVVCPPEALAATLLAWAAEVPHGLRHP